MIEEDYVSFETAKLLKEKGFDECCYLSYHYNESFGRWFKTSEYIDSRFKKYYYPCPTLQMATKWLRDVHNLIISIEFTIHGWICGITKIVRDSSGFIVNINHGVGDDALPYCDEYEKSCETAIKYCLENLI